MTTSTPETDFTDLADFTDLVDINEEVIHEQVAVLSNLALSNLIVNMNLLQQNAISIQQAMNQVTMAVAAKAVNAIIMLSPVEAASIVKLNTGNDVAEQIADLKAAVEAFGNSGQNGKGNKS